MQFLQQLQIQKENEGSSTGAQWIKSKGEKIASFSPVDNTMIGAVTTTDKAAYDQVIETAQAAFIEWRNWPAPKRGEVVRQLGEALRKDKAALGQLVSYEMGKSLQEGLGEVQEMIDICDFAVGLSRQLYGLTMHSERPSHRMYEQWHPMGIVGIISAFNFLTLRVEFEYQKSFLVLTYFPKLHVDCAYQSHFCFNFFKLHVVSYMLISNIKVISGLNLVN